MRITSSQKYRRAALAGASVLVVGATTLVALNTVSATNLSGDDPDPVLPTDCQIDTLPVPDDSSMSIVSAMDPTGTYIGGRSYPADPEADFFRQAIIWENEEKIEVDFPGLDQTIQDINSHGDAVGFSFEETDSGYAAYSYAYLDGEVVELEPDLNSRAEGINDDGTIVGTIEESDERHAVVFTDDGAQRLDVPDDTESSSVVDIDADGSIIGSVEIDDGTMGSVPYRWDADGVPEELTLSDEVDGNLSLLIGMSDGWIAGYLVDDVDVYGTAMWAPGETEATEVEFAGTNDLNSYGWLAGGQDNVGVVYADGDIYELPSMHDDSEIIDRADAISHDGTVIAGSVNWDLAEETSLEAAVWNCE